MFYIAYDFMVMSFFYIGFVMYFWNKVSRNYRYLLNHPAIFLTFLLVGPLFIITFPLTDFFCKRLFARY